MSFADATIERLVAQYDEPYDELLTQHTALEQVREERPARVRSAQRVRSACLDAARTSRCDSM